MKPYRHGQGVDASQRVIQLKARGLTFHQNRQAYLRVHKVQEPTENTEARARPPFERGVRGSYLQNGDMLTVFEHMHNQRKSFPARWVNRPPRPNDWPEQFPAVQKDIGSTVIRAPNERINRLHF